MRYRDDPNGPYQRFVVEHGHHDHHMLGWIVFFLLLALVVALIAWVLLRVVGPRTGAARIVGAPLDSALDTVRMRYARGEVDREEFLRISGDLSGLPEPPPAPSA